MTNELSAGMTFLSHFRIGPSLSYPSHTTSAPLAAALRDQLEREADGRGPRGPHQQVLPQHQRQRQRRQQGRNVKKIQNTAKLKAQSS